MLSRVPTTPRRLERDHVALCLAREMVRICAAVEQVCQTEQQAARAGHLLTLPLAAVAGELGMADQAAALAATLAPRAATGALPPAA